MAVAGHSAPSDRDPGPSAPGEVSSRDRGSLPAPLRDALPGAMGSPTRPTLKGPQTRLVETNVARTPVFSLSPRGVASGSRWRVVGSLYKSPVEISTPMGSLSVRDALSLMEVTTDYVRLGGPDDRVVPLSLNDYAERLGYGSKGGHTLSLVASSIDRLTAVVIRQRILVRTSHADVLWHLIDRWDRVGRGSRQLGAVRLSQEYAELVDRGNVTYLDSRILDQLTCLPRIGMLATRLYIFLASEQGLGNRYWRYSVFPVRTDAAPFSQSPAIVDLVGLTDGRRQRTLEKLRQAAAAIEAADPRYEVVVAPARTVGQANLVARRTRDIGGHNSGTVGTGTRDIGGSARDRGTAVTSLPNVPNQRHGLLSIGTILEETGLATIGGSSLRPRCGPPDYARPRMPVDGEEGGTSEFRDRTLPGLNPDVAAMVGGPPGGRRPVP